MKIIMLGILFTLTFLTERTYPEHSPCGKNDLTCSATMSTIFIKTLIANGMPDHNIDKMIPLHLHSFQSEVLEGVLNHFSNIVFNGMSNTEVTYHRLKFEESSVEMKLKFNLSATADYLSEVKRIPRNYTGVFTIGIISDVQIQFAYELSPDRKGDKYFTLLQETANCENLESEVSVDNTLLQIVKTDPDFEPELNRYMKDKKILDNRQACVFVKAVVAKIFDNMRLASKIEPASYYIIDI